MTKIFLTFLISVYQWCFRPFVGNSCRFYPSCSDYAKEALQKKGAFFGSWLTIKRLLKCHPYHPGGHDPVEEAEEEG